MTTFLAYAGAFMMGLGAGIIGMYLFMGKRKPVYTLAGMVEWLSKMDFNEMENACDYIIEWAFAGLRTIHRNPPKRKGQEKEAFKAFCDSANDNMTCGDFVKKYLRPSGRIDGTPLGTSLKAEYPKTKE